MRDGSRRQLTAALMARTLVLSLVACTKAGDSKQVEAGRTSMAGRDRGLNHPLLRARPHHPNRGRQDGRAHDHPWRPGTSRLRASDLRQVALTGISTEDEASTAQLSTIANPNMSDEEVIAKYSEGYGMSTDKLEEALLAESHARRRGRLRGC